MSALKDWQTTVAGFILGAIPIEQQIAASLTDHASIDWRQVLFGLGIMVFGVLSKDAFASRSAE
jgi:hypothetical protein